MKWTEKPQLLEGHRVISASGGIGNEQKSEQSSKRYMGVLGATKKTAQHPHRAQGPSEWWVWFKEVLNVSIIAGQEGGGEEERASGAQGQQNWVNHAGRGAVGCPGWGAGNLWGLALRSWSIWLRIPGWEGAPSSPNVVQSVFHHYRQRPTWGLLSTVPQPGGPDQGVVVDPCEPAPGAALIPPWWWVPHLPVGEASQDWGATVSPPGSHYHPFSTLGNHSPRT